MKTQSVHLLFLLLFVVACHSPGNNSDRQLSSIFATDTLFEPTGEAQLDSLLQLATVARPDTNLAKLYYQISEIYENNDFEKAKDYYLKLKDLSEQLDWNTGRYMFAGGFSIMLAREGLMDSAVMVNRWAYEFAVKEKNEKQIAIIATNTGTIYRAKEWYETALEYYMEAIAYFEPQNDAKALVRLYQNMCQLYNSLYITEKAVEFGEKAYALNNKDPYVVNSLAKVYANAYQYEKANKYFEEALEICKSTNNIFIMGEIYWHLGNNAMDVFDLEKGEAYARKAMDCAKEIGNTNIFPELILLSKIEQLKGNYAQSETSIREAMQMAEEFDILLAKRVCYMILSELAVAQHNYRESAQCWVELDKIDNAIAKETTLHAIAEKEAKYETEKKQLEIERQQHIIARQNMQRNVFVVSVIVLLVFLALLWYMLRLRTRRNLALMERNDALAEINATKDKFFNIISHDLKNPAVAQRDALRTLVVHARSWDADRLADYHAELLKVAEEQAELIYNLLGWGQLQTGRILYSPVLFSLSARLRSDITLLRDMANYKGITLNTQMPDNALVTGDVNMLSTVVRNLLTNAVKFTAEGGTVTLDVSPCKGVARNALTADDAPTKYTVSVADTGTGMSDEQVQNLFRLDRQTSKRGTAGEQGTGLGLIVCKEFLEKHGSVLHVESVEGKGSRFWFEI